MHVSSFLFFCLRGKRKEMNQRKENFADYNTAFGGIRPLAREHVFLPFRQKSLSTAKDNAVRLLSLYQRRRCLRRLIDFCPSGQKRMYNLYLYLMSGAMPLSIAIISVFFFSVCFSFCIAIKKKSRLLK